MDDGLVQVATCRQQFGPAGHDQQVPVGEPVSHLRLGELGSELIDSDVTDN
jgi:hypothetical protein